MCNLHIIIFLVKFDVLHKKLMTIYNLKKPNITTHFIISLCEILLLKHTQFTFF